LFTRDINNTIENSKIKANITLERATTATVISLDLPSSLIEE